MSVAVIIPAAGKGVRFGGREKKPYVHLDGRPIWQRACELFWQRPDVSTVYLVVAPDDLDEFRSRYGHVIAFASVKLVAGGAERFDSVANGLAAVADEEFVAVHDAVRPLTPAGVIDLTFAAARKQGAAVPGLPLADTLKRVEEGTRRITETVPRAGLWQVQTPQVFRRDWLLDAYARRGTLTGPITDDAQLLEAAGHPVTVVQGSIENFKITTREDLGLASAVLRARESKPAPKNLHPFGDEARW